MSPVGPLTCIACAAHRSVAHSPLSLPLSLSLSVTWTQHVSLRVFLPQIPPRPCSLRPATCHTDPAGVAQHQVKPWHKTAALNASPVQRNFLGDLATPTLPLPQAPAIVACHTAQLVVSSWYPTWSADKLRPNTTTILTSLPFELPSHRHPHRARLGCARLPLAPAAVAD
jgi:hypothetical protein